MNLIIHQCFWRKIQASMHAYSRAMEIMFRDTRVHHGREFSFCTRRVRLPRGRRRSVTIRSSWQSRSTIIHSCLGWLFKALVLCRKEKRRSGIVSCQRIVNHRVWGGVHATTYRNGLNLQSKLWRFLATEFWPISRGYVYLKKVKSTNIQQLAVQIDLNCCREAGQWWKDHRMIRGRQFRVHESRGAVAFCDNSFLYLYDIVKVSYFYCMGLGKASNISLLKLHNIFHVSKETNMARISNLVV